MSVEFVFASIRFKPILLTELEAAHAHKVRERPVIGAFVLGGRAVLKSELPGVEDLTVAG